MKAAIKLLLEVAIGIATIIGALLVDDPYGMLAIACVGSWAINILIES